MAVLQHRCHVNYSNLLVLSRLTSVTLSFNIETRPRLYEPIGEVELPRTFVVYHHPAPQL